jgi:hypothetical protein
MPTRAIPPGSGSSAAHESPLIVRSDGCPGVLRVSSLTERGRDGNRALFVGLLVDYCLLGGIDLHPA